MTTKSDLTRCMAYLDCQLGLFSTCGKLDAHKQYQRPAVTISRQTGSGGRLVAEKLVQYLEQHAPKHKCPWTIFDRNLVEKVCEDHDLPKRMAEYLPEDRRSLIDEIMEELVGLHPPSWTLFHQMVETVLHLAEMGNVVLIGRGANLITAKMSNVFHVRIVASMESRQKRVEAMHPHLQGRAALDFIEKEEEGRRRFIKQYFKCNLDDPLLYHLIINTDKVPPEEAAELIGREVVRRCKMEEAG